MLAEFTALAGLVAEVFGSRPIAQLRHHNARARGLIFTGEEDFGIVPMEVIAGHRPIVAFNRSGAVEMVGDGRTGDFLDEWGEDALIDAVNCLERLPLDSVATVLHGQQFNPAHFEHQVRVAIAEAWTQAHGRLMPIIPGPGYDGAVLPSRRRLTYA